jgi:hypothetical protein
MQLRNCVVRAPERNHLDCKFYRQFFSLSILSQFSQFSQLSRISLSFCRKNFQGAYELGLRDLTSLLLLLLLLLLSQ